MRMPTLLPYGEGCMSGEAIDTRTRSIRRVVGTARRKGGSWLFTSNTSHVRLLCYFPRSEPLVDGEIVASNVRGVPDFWRLFRKSPERAEIHVWAFDLLALNGKDIRKWSQEARQGRLQALLTRFDCPAVLCSEPFNDGLTLLRVAEKHGLEGVVSKRRDAPYRSGKFRGWRKIKTAAWREANRERWRSFEQ